MTDQINLPSTASDATHSEHGSRRRKRQGNDQPAAKSIHAPIPDYADEVPIEPELSPVAVVSSTLTEVELSVPMFSGEWSGFAGRRRIDVKLNGETAKKLRRIQFGLEQLGAELKNRRAVSTPGHAIIWLLENIPE